MLADLFEVRETESKGKGLFAKKFIPKGTISSFQCKACKVVTAEELGYDKMSDKEKLDLFCYAYRREDGLFVLPCGIDRYMNHSCNANILGTELGFDIVVRDIREGEEATFDYRDFYESIKMPCCCGEENCCKEVTFEHPIPEDLKKFWHDRTESAIQMIDKVDQPLKEVLKGEGKWPFDE